jgi:predicted RNA-binding Zn-ribbon protein involved in translation (DUF1610 family)
MRPGARGAGVARLRQLRSNAMPDYLCAHCELEFVSEEKSSDGTPCPRCGQTESVRSVDTSALIRDIRRQWYVVFGILLLAAVGFILYQWMKRT